MSKNTFSDNVSMGDSKDPVAFEEEVSETIVSWVGRLKYEGAVHRRHTKVGRPNFNIQLAMALLELCSYKLGRTIVLCKDYSRSVVLDTVQGLLEGYCYADSFPTNYYLYGGEADLEISNYSVVLKVFVADKEMLRSDKICLLTEFLDAMIEDESNCYFCLCVDFLLTAELTRKLLSISSRYKYIFGNPCYDGVSRLFVVLVRHNGSVDEYVQSLRNLNFLVNDYHTSAKHVNVANSVHFNCWVRQNYDWDMVSGAGFFF
jgi:hypothetical protein